MVKAAAERGTRLFVNHQRRYGKPFEWMKETVDEKKVGELVGIDIVLPGTNLLNMGTHLVDAALFFLGDRWAERVFAAVDLSPEAESQGLPVEHYSLATVHFSEGTRLTVEAGREVPEKLPIIRAQGTDGFAELHYEVPEGAQSIFRARLAGQAEIFNPPTNEHFHHSEDYNLYVKRAAADISRGLETGAPTRIDAEHAVRGIEIILGIYESARRGRMVTFPLKLQDFPLDLMIKT